jgi:hypothetical protein
MLIGYARVSTDEQNYDSYEKRMPSAALALAGYRPDLKQYLNLHKSSFYPVHSGGMLVKMTACLPENAAFSNGTPRSQMRWPRIGVEGKRVGFR